MFTGIVNGSFPIVYWNKKTIEGTTTAQLAIDLSEPLLHQLQIGASVAVNGVCLTVVDIKDTVVYFDLIQETLELTNLKQCKVGDSVHIERSLVLGGEVGGHLLSGHVHTTVCLMKKEYLGDNVKLSFALPEQFKPYIFPKGYIAIDGVSLTIGKTIDEQSFYVYLIPETCRLTRLSQLIIGDRVNIEIDQQTRVIVDTVQNMLKAGYQF